MTIQSNINNAILSQDKTLCSPKLRVTKSKKSDAELVEIFWAAATEAFFGQETVC
jgi:hypothetical protein